MIARKVCEDSYGKVASPHSFHRERVRAYFQHCVRSASVANFGKHLLQIQRFRRGIYGLTAAPWSFIASRADTSGCKTRDVQYGIDEKSCGRLPICPSDSDKLQRVSRVPVEIRSRQRQSATFRAGDYFYPVDARLYFRRPRLRTRNSNGSAFDGVDDKLVAVRLASRQSKEQSALRHLPAIACDRKDIWIRSRIYFDCLNSV